jgi:hypothetical protein
LARPREAARLPHLRQSRACWKHWHGDETLTAHDGLVTSDHPAILAALSRTQSTTSLQRLLRDPLGFVWRYALGWRVIQVEPEPLQLGPTAFGELVHELISLAIKALEPKPGFACARADEIEAAIAAAAAKVLTSWPMQRSVPPAILWRHTVGEAARRTVKGLASDDPIKTGARSWSEVPFGQDEVEPAGRLPWGVTAKIPIGRPVSSMAAASIGSTSAPLAKAYTSPITRAPSHRPKVSVSRSGKAVNCSAYSMRWRSERSFPR